MPRTLPPIWARAPDKLGKRFRVLSLNDNVSWMTALGNDYAYEDVFVRQLMNYARAGDLVLAMSVSGNSPNVVKAIEWSVKNGLQTVALVGAKRGRLAELAHTVIVIDSDHYGRVEDAHMGNMPYRLLRVYGESAARPELERVRKIVFGHRPPRPPRPRCCLCLRGRGGRRERGRTDGPEFPYALLDLTCS